ncbi:Omega-amidase nit3 [Ascosphaera atra]|nr:Omega-amidase nit3 [Ascosphaera atra]
MAAEAKAYLVGGSIPEFVPESKQYYNTSLIFSPSGSLIGTHRKVHLFDIDIPGKITFKESEVLTPGNKVTLIDLPEYGRIAVAICYDVRFPELAMIAARKGAFALIYPGAFNLTTGPLHWSLLARSRANDNQVFVGMCSPARDMSATYHAWGHSLICAPNGEIVTEAGEDECIVTADLDPKTLEDTRKGIPIYGQRRFDVYPDVSQGNVRYEDLSDSFQTLTNFRFRTRLARRNPRSRLGRFAGCLVFIPRNAHRQYPQSDNYIDILDQ